MKAFVQRKSSFQHPSILENKETNYNQEMDVDGDKVFDEHSEINNVNILICERVRVQLSDSAGVSNMGVSPCNFEINDAERQNIYRDNVDHAAVHDMGAWPTKISQTSAI